MTPPTSAKMDGKGEEAVIPPNHTASSPNKSCPANQAPSPPPISPLLRLPPELLSLTLSHVPPHLHQQTALALHKVFPDYGLADEHLWRHVMVRRGDQLMPLWKAARARRQRMRMRMEEEVAREMDGQWMSGGEEVDEEEMAMDERVKEMEASLALGRRLGTQSFAMESWRGDADLLNNALRCLPHLPTMMLNLGTNFAPEHLEEMFEEPRIGLERLEMRFRPYVEQASYYQFLKGSYFDSAIETLTRKWPAVKSFTHLSIVQDLPPRSTAPPTAMHSIAASAMTSAAQSIATSTVASAVASASVSAISSAVASPHIGPSEITDKVSDLKLDSSDEDDESSDHSTPPTSVSDSPVTASKGYTGHGPFPYLSDRIGWAKPKSFAQPIVFFDIDCITRFGNSPIARNLTHLRLRVPSRNIAAVLCGPATGPPPFPSITYLDISTTNVLLDAFLTTLLKRHERLEHLVIDRVNLFGFQARDKGLEMCHNLGGMVLSACLARGKERERAIANWDVAERARIARAQEAARRSISSESASLIDQAQREAQAAADERERQIALARSRRGHRSMAQSTFSMRDRPSRFRSNIAGPSASGSALPTGPLPPTDRMYLVLPPLPSLKTLSIGGEASHVSAKGVREWTNEFHAGWRDGQVKLLGWATHIGERYERAKKKADEWVMAEARSAIGTPSKGGNGGGKGKVAKAPKVTPTKPPTDVRLFRFPFPSESVEGDVGDRDDPTMGLVELSPVGRQYLDAYREAIADSELHANDYSYPPSCVLCTVPDCEGPLRRGDEGGRVDGRGGMEGQHVDSCGHSVGRGIWGWEGVK